MKFSINTYVQPRGYPKGCEVAKVTMISENVENKISSRLRGYESYGGCAGQDCSVIFKGILKVARLQRLQ